MPGSRPASTCTRSSNWDPTYTFGSNLQAANALSGATYDKYAELFYDQTNSYGAGYSDYLMKSLAVGPLMSLWNGSGNTGLTVNLFADSDTPSTAKFNGTVFTDGMGYGGAPVMNNYIAPVGADYVDLTGASATYMGANNLSINLGSASVVADADVTVTFGMYMGGGQFKTVVLPLHNGSVYNTYALSSDLGTVNWAAKQVTGTINITGLPVASDGSASWYQITVAEGGVSKTFNLYANSNSATHQFYNPSMAGQAAQVQIDGLGVVAGTGGASPPQYVSALSVAFLSSSGFGLDPSLLTQLTDQSQIQSQTNGIFVPPYAPVVGTGTGATFSAIRQAGFNYGAMPTPNGYIDPSSVNGTLVTFTMPDTLSQSKLSFGWWGADQSWVSQATAARAPVLDHADPDTASSNANSRWNAANWTYNGQVLNDYTNKVGATNVAMIQFVTSDSSGTYASHSLMTATADIDGKWATATKLFVAGNTYKAVMWEYAATDTSFQHPLNKVSDGIVFSVGSGGGGDSSLAGSNSIQFNPGTTGSDGAWVHLEATNSTLPNGTLFVYFTDANGNLLDRNDNPTASLQDAIRSEIGLVKTDGGVVMFSGTQSVYLPAGMQMKFAIQVGADVVKELPNIQVSGSGSLSVAVSDTSGVLHLTAAFDNSPGPNANLALSQQEFDHAWVYLTQGQTLKVDVAGSAYNNNTVHLLHIDVNAADPGNVAGWSVGGVAWGNTDAFRAAVMSSWDAGYAVSGGRGNFQNTQNWTASQSGYYAPVLMTEGGDVFVVGSAANVDGQSHIRHYGQNMFGFEDLKGGDWDYNDLVMKLTTT